MDNLGYKQKTLNEISTSPQISDAMVGWGTKLTLTKVTQEIKNGFVNNTEFQYCFQGTFQPLKAEQIALKPEGQRSWSWFMIHWFTSCQDLKTNDIIYYKGQRYKVMAIFDYSANNYIEYQVIHDFQNT